MSVSREQKHLNVSCGSQNNQRLCFLLLLNQLPAFTNHVKYFVFFLLGDFPASEFYKPTFRNTICSIFIGTLLSNWLKLFLSQTLSHIDTYTILKFSHYSPSCL
jgi:hypothetical protein